MPIRIFIILLCLFGVPSSLEAEQDESQSKESFWSKVKQTTQNAAQTMSNKAAELSNDATSSVAELSQYSEKAFDEFMLGVEQNIQLLEEMGYVVTDLYVGVDLVPRVSFRIAKVKQIDVTKQQKLLASHNNRVLKYIVEKLNTAYAMEFGDYQIKAVKMDLGLPPQTSVHFINQTAKRHAQKYMD